MLKSQLREWQSNEVTEFLHEVLAERINNCAEELLASRKDPENDIFLKGMAHGLREVLYWEPETKEEKDEDAVSS